MLVSVILCTHNPRGEVLEETLEGLKRQTFDENQWELLLIDNASKLALTDRFVSVELPAMRIIREETLGLTPARLRGIRESRGDLLVFVDDDNVLNPGYLEHAWSIFQSRPYLGAFGGSITPEFEEPPPDWTHPYWYLLAVRETPYDRWGHLPGNAELEPCGAGLCVRREVAESYREVVEKDPLRASLDRRGQSLASAGDMDLVACALDMGLAIGRFKDLQLVHLIPPARLRPEYLLRLYEEMVFSGELLKRARGHQPNQMVRTLKGDLRQWLRRCMMSKFDRLMMNAAERGKIRAGIAWKIGGGDST